MKTAITIVVAVISSGVLSTLLTEIFTTIREKKKTDSEDDRAIKLALQALLQDKIEEKYNEYMEADKCSIKNKQIFHNLYLAYHSLNLPNGIMEHCDDEVMNLSEY